jgi:hypothetical protein
MFLQLVLRENDLIDIPKEIGELQRLRELHLQGNRLTMLPPELGKLKLKKKKENLLFLLILCEICSQFGHGQLKVGAQDGEQSLGHSHRRSTPGWRFPRHGVYSYGDLPIVSIFWPVR